MKLNYKQLNAIYNGIPSMDAKTELAECGRTDHDFCVVVNGHHMDAMGRIDDLTPLELLELTGGNREVGSATTEKKKEN